MVCIRDLKQRRRRRQGRRLEKNEFIFYRRISHMPRPVQYVYRSQNLLKLNMQCERTIPKENTKNKPPSLTFSKIPRTWSFHVVVLQRTAKKCTKNYNARAQLLFCSLNLLFCGVLVAVAVVVCLRSLMSLLRSLLIHHLPTSIPGFLPVISSLDKGGWV